MVQGIQVLNWPVGEFQDKVVHVQSAKEIDQRAPISLLNRLAAIITETQMDGPFRFHLIEEHIEGSGRQGSVSWIACNIGFNYLQTGAGKVCHLLCHDSSNR